MKIYNSTEYIENPQVGDLKLKVISQWDFKSDAVCFGKIYEGQKNESTIPYSLEQCVEVRNKGWTKWEKAKIDEEIIKELINKNYVISSKLK